MWRKIWKQRQYDFIMFCDEMSATLLLSICVIPRLGGHSEHQKQL